MSDDDVRAEAEKEFKENIEPNLSFYSQYFGISDVDDYIEHCGGMAEIKQNKMFLRLVYQMTGLEMPGDDSDQTTDTDSDTENQE